MAVTLWMDPESDPSFSRAIKENRVLTLIQPRSSNHKDYGIIGFHKDPHASYLLFPRSLPQDGDLRVVGIRYELVDERPVGQVVLPRPAKREKPKPLPGKEQKPSPAEKSEAPVEQPKRPPVEKPKLSVIGKPKLPVAKEKPKPVRVQPPPPVQKKFTVQVRRISTVDTTVTVQARDRQEAERQAFKSVKKKPFASNDSGVREETVITRVDEKA